MGNARIGTKTHTRQEGVYSNCIGVPLYMYVYVCVHLSYS